MNQIKRESALNLQGSKIAKKKQNKLSSRLKTEGETKQNKLSLKLKAKAEKAQKKSTLALKLKSAKSEEEVDSPLVQPKKTLSYSAKKAKARKYGLARKLTQTGKAKKGKSLSLKLKDSARPRATKAQILLGELRDSKLLHRRERRAQKASPIMLEVKDIVDDALAATTEAAVEAEQEAVVADEFADQDPNPEVQLLASVAEEAAQVASTEEEVANTLADGPKTETTEAHIIIAETTAEQEKVIATEAAQQSAEISGKVADDPHFTGFDGSTYDFQGKINKVYNLVTDKYFQLNARFIAAPKVSNTYMGALGVRVHENTIVIEPFSVTINGQAAHKGAYELKTRDEKDGNAGAVYIEKGFVSIVTKGFMVSAKVIRKDGVTYLNVETSVQSDHLVHPHGLLGQTARYLLSTQPAHPVHLPHSNKWAAGFIEGIPMDYMVGDGILGQEFSYNRFGIEAQAVRTFTSPRFAIGRASHAPKKSGDL